MKLKSLIYRPLQLAGLLFALLLLLALTVLVAMSWSNQQRIDAIRASVERTHAVQRIGLQLQQMLLADIEGSAPVQRPALEATAAQIESLVKPAADLSSDTADGLRRAVRLLDSPDMPPRAALAAALEEMRRATHGEIGVVTQRLSTIDRDARAESRLALAALAVLPALLILALVLLRHRIVNPLNNLAEVLLRLADSQFTPVPLHHVDPLLLPLLDNYNRMVARLQELEAAHRSHTDSLQAEVRAAARTLLQQSSSLAQVEKLAAVGEMAAGVAHELRNPLAGVHLALVNLRRERPLPETAERLDLVIAELERIIRLLNEMLAQARHAPEAERPVDVAQVIRDLTALARYQAPASVVIEVHVPESLPCRLPESRLRQALLNLMLNAIQALESGGGTVSVAAGRHDGGVLISVSDDGAGFAPDLLERGVRPFVSGRAAGIGLGLTMVHRFARDAGGGLELANRQPRGARATLTLPCGS